MDAQYEYIQGCSVLMLSEMMKWMKALSINAEFVESWMLSIDAEIVEIFSDKILF